MGLSGSIALLCRCERKVCAASMSTLVSSRTVVGRLVEIAPHYYDLSNFPKGEARRALERLYLKMAAPGSST